MANYTHPTLTPTNESHMSKLFSLYLKMLILYNPFFVLSYFIDLNHSYTLKKRKHLT